MTNPIAILIPAMIVAFTPNVMPAAEVTPPPPIVEVLPSPAPTPACAEGELLAEDLSCVPADFYAEPAEDDPEFDCRVHGNHICGVEVEGHTYLLDYDTMTFTLR